MSLVNDLLDRYVGPWLFNTLADADYVSKSELSEVALAFSKDMDQLDRNFFFEPPDDLQVFGGDADITREVVARTGKLAALYNRGIVTVMLEQPTDKLSDNGGVVYIVPNALQTGFFRYGGFAEKIAGIARLRNSKGDEKLGSAYWTRGPDNRLSIVMEVDGQLVESGHPWGFYYGLIAHVTIPIP